MWGISCAIAAGALAFACSSSNSPLVVIDTTAVCDKLVNRCGDTKLGGTDACAETYGVFRVTSQCANDLKTASCDDLQSATSKVHGECFPSCSTPHSYACNGNGTITECDPDPNLTAADGGEGPSIQSTLDCASVCATEGLKFSGTCGAKYGDDEADHALCWCISQ